MATQKNINTDKELELVATIYDFIEEAIDKATPAEPYDEKQVRKSFENTLENNTIILDELSRFDLDEYNNYVDHDLLSSVRVIKNTLQDELNIWIQEDKGFLYGFLNAYEPAQLMQEARRAQYRLQEDLRSFKIEVNKFFKRYMADHDGKEPEEDINSYRIRKKTIKTLLN